MSKYLIIKDIDEIVTPIGKKAKFGSEMNDVKIYNNKSILIEDGIIKKIGDFFDVRKNIDIKDLTIVNGRGRAAVPGFIDSHTHFIFAGTREDEFIWRLEGKTYMQIMNMGGGIINTVKDTRKASFEKLYSLGKSRLKNMMKMGVTTVEGKSGYGLDLIAEIKQLEVMKKLNEDLDIDIISTYLGAHAIPSEFEDADSYIDFIIKKVMPEVKEKELAEFFDVFCEEGVFDIKQSEKLYDAAKALGFKLKIHADEIVDTGGANLAAKYHMTSADHLLHSSKEGIKNMQENKVITTLLPTTAFCLKEEFANARYMIDSGCALALASDFNPGSGFTFSIPLMISLATIYMKMSLNETLTAITLNAAAALDLADKKGSIEEGKIADITILKYPSYKFLPYHTGINIVNKVIKNGKLTIENN